MKSKKIITLIAFLFAVISVNAQLEISRDGRLTGYSYLSLSYNGPGDYFLHKSSSRNLKVPTYIKHTKSVKVTISTYEYDHFDDLWKKVSFGGYKYKIEWLFEFDSTGLLKEITEDNDDIYKLSYENGKMKTIGSWDVSRNNWYYIIKCNYDKTGHLSKTSTGVSENHIFWTPQGELSRIEVYREGYRKEVKNFKITPTAKGKRIQRTVSGEPYTYSYEEDKYGCITREGKKYMENQYDENGNLIFQATYELRDLGKYYTLKVQFEYEYEFYDFEAEERQRKEAEAERLRMQAEQERQRREAEEKARREKEIRDVEALVGNNIAQAKSNRETGQLQAAAVLLQEGIDATISHNHDYRKEEMAQLLDTIRQLQAEVSDTSKVLDYKRFRPDLYEATGIRLTNRVQNYLAYRVKSEKRNSISFTLNTFGQPGVFQMEKSSKALKEFCNTTLAIEKLQPIAIDERQVKAQATFNYTFEYAKGTVTVKQKGAQQRVNVKFDVSPELEQRISTAVTDKLSNLSSWEYSGRYKFNVAAMDINGQTHHSVELKNAHLYNGPQNFLRSLIVPGWGDKYVEADRKFDWWKTLISYGATAAGTGVVLYSNKMKKASETIHYEKVVTGYNSDGTPIYYDRPVSNSNSNNGMYAYYSYIGYGLIAVGVGLWLYDVIYVGVKGTKNKNEEKAQMGWYLTYDVANNAPEVGYSLRF